jgi:heme-degrading monooxygenase HmoA
MTYSQIRIEVKDYTSWRTGFDASDALRRSYGATGNNTVYRDRENQNAVTLVMEWEDEKRAQEYFRSPALREAQQKAGVTKVLDTHLLERV